MKYTSTSNEGILVDLATGSGFFGQDWDPQETSGTTTLLIIMLCMRACSVVFDSLRPCGLQPTRLLCPWDSPGKSTGVGCHFLLQGIFLTQGLNPHLL